MTTYVIIRQLLSGSETSTRSHGGGSESNRPRVVSTHEGEIGARAQLNALVHSEIIANELNHWNIQAIYEGLDELEQSGPKKGQVMGPHTAQLVLTKRGVGGGWRREILFTVARMDFKALRQAADIYKQLTYEKSSK